MANGIDYSFLSCILPQLELILCIEIAVSDEEIDGLMDSGQTTQKQDNVCLPTEILVIWRH